MFSDYSNIFHRVFFKKYFLENIKKYKKCSFFIIFFYHNNIILFNNNVFTILIK